jgi:phenylalanyl-tRNA synthetase beta chain
MKVLYSEIKNLIPGLKASPKEVGETLTLTGFMMDGLEEVSYKGKKDFLISLEIRQNRADCLSVIGLAREVAAYYNLKVNVTSVKKIKEIKENLNIKIEAKDYVRRVLAVSLDSVENNESPEWLKEYMYLYGLATAGILVDLSNYVMIMTGYPSHLIDSKKIEGIISWSINDQSREIETISGLKTKLNTGEIIIKDDKDVLALAGIIGGNKGIIDNNTKSLIVEFAVYDRSIIRKNSRSLNISTEASKRLEKELDPNGIDYAMELLVSLILEHAKGKITSSFFSYYPKKHISPKIKFNERLSSDLSGIEISNKETLRILKGLNFFVSKDLIVIPPTYRMDVSLPEDVAEEIIRIYGYDKIPTNEIPKLEIVKNITPPNIILSDKIRDTLNTLGFDEILSWPLTQKGVNAEINYLKLNEIFTQNSVNELYPNLRQSIASGLLNQMNEYFKKGVEYIDIFEIGKVFGESNKKYIEYDSLGLLSVSKENSLPQFKNKIDLLLRILGFKNISYLNAEIKPKISNPNSCWDIYIKNQCVGIIYKLVPSEIKLNTYFAEINIQKITEILLKVKNNPVVEITQKLTFLDVNVEIKDKSSIYEIINLLEKNISSRYLWSINVIDIYNNKYTLRITYKELSDKESKAEHAKVLEIINSLK